MEIYFVARNEACMRQFNWRSISACSILRSNQAAIVCLQPSYRPVTVSLFYQPHHRTAVWIMIKLVRLTTRSSHVCRHPAQPRDHLPASYYLAYIALSTSPSAGRPPIRSPDSWSACCCPPPLRRSPAPPVGSRPPVGRYQVTRSLLRFSPRHSCDRLSVVPTVSRRRHRRPPKHVLSYENGDCQFAGPYSYGLLIWSFNQVSRSKLISFGFNLAYG